MNFKKSVYVLLSAVIIIGISLSVSQNVYADDKAGEIRLIVRGDDIGFCHAANVACIESYRDGIVRSVEVMVPCPWFNEAVEMLNNNPGLDVGVHLTVTCEWDNMKWGPVVSKNEVPSLLNKEGFFYMGTVQTDDFPPNSGFREANPKPEEMEKELRAQIELALAKIKNVTHLSSHMGAPSCTPELKAVVEKLSKEYNLPIGVPGAKRAGRFVRSTSAYETEKALVDVLENLGPGLYILVEHPGMDTPEMRAVGHINSRHVAVKRDGVTKAFTSEWVKDVIRKKGIKLVSYGDVLREMR